MPATASTDTDVTSVADREILPSLGARDFGDVAAAIQRKMSVAEEAFNQPLASKVLRAFKTSEILDLADISGRQLRAWRQEHLDELVHGRDGITHPLTLPEIHRMMESFGIRPRRPTGSRALRLGVFNFKGGSAKSTFTLNFSVFCAIHGYRVLVLDSDPQGSLTSLFGYDSIVVDEGRTLAPVFRAVSDPSRLEAVSLSPLSTHIAGLDLVPASLGMIGSDMAIANAFVSRAPNVRRFYECVDRAIRTVEERYDLVLIDGAPAFSFAALATFWAVDGVVVPMPPEATDFKATGAFFSMVGDSIESICRSAGKDDRRWSPVVVVHSRAKSSQSSELIRNFSRDVFTSRRMHIDSIIPDVSAVPNALARFRSIYEVTSSEVDARSLRRARDTYGAVSRQILDLVHRAWRLGVAREGQSP